MRFLPILLACCLVASGCATPDPASSSADGTAAAVQQLLDTRAAALNEGDLAAFMAPVTASGPDAEENLANSLANLPVEEVGFRLRPESVGTSFPTDAQAQLVYRFAGTAEDNTFAVDVEYRILETADGLRIDRVTVDLADIPPWMETHGQWLSSERIVAVYRAGMTEVAELVEVAQQAAAELQEQVPVAMDPGFLIVLAASDLEYQTLTGRDLLEGLPRVAQAVTKYTVTPGQYRAHSRHAVVNLDRLAREGTGPQTLKHELAHLALAPVTRPVTPGWVTEGAAMYLAGQRPNWTERVVNGSFEDVSFERLSSRMQLGGEGPTGDTAGLEYAYAAGGVYYLVEQFGEEAFWAFYRGFADLSPERIYQALPTLPQPPGEGPLAGLARSNTVGLLEEHFALSPQQLDQAVRAYIGEQS